MSEQLNQNNDHTAGEPYTDAELISMLRDCDQSHGGATIDKFAKDPLYCSAETVIRRFGTWELAKREAQIDTDKNLSVFGDQYSKEQICSHLRELHRRHGSATPGLLNNEEDLLETAVIIDTFGSWDNALAQAGLAND